MRTSVFAIIAIIAFTALPALAQVPPAPIENPPAVAPPVTPAPVDHTRTYQGFWGCQMTFTEYRGPNPHSSAFDGNFGMLLNEDLTYGIEGVQPGLGSYYGNGKWSADANGLLLQGQETLPPYPPIPCVIVTFKPDGQGALTQLIDTPAFQGNFTAQSSLFACTRQQMPQPQ